MKVTKSVLLSLLLIALPMICRGQQSSELRNRVLKEYAPALARLEEFYSHIRVEGTLDEIRIEEDKSVTEDSFRWSLAVEGRSKKSARTRLKKRNSALPSENVSCVNPKYSFRLEMVSDGAPLRIRDMGAGFDANIANDMNVVFNRYVFAPFCIFDTPIAKIMSDPTFVVKNVSEVTERDKRCLKIEFSFHPNKKYPVVPGWWLVCPDEGWILLEYEVLLGSHEDVSKHGRIEYGPSVGGIPLPKVFSETHPYYRRHFEFERIDQGPVPESEFTLTSFGLPELERPDGSRFTGGPAIWFFASSLLFLSIGVVLKFKGSRKEAPALSQIGR